MKFSVLSLFAVLSSIPAAMALPDVVAARAAPPGPTFLPSVIERRELVKRDNEAVVKVDGLDYRACPRISYDCPSKGQYAINTHITLHCYTRDNTTAVKCDLGWGKIATNGYWVPLAWGQYVAWEGGLPYC